MFSGVFLAGQYVPQQDDDHDHDGDCDGRADDRDEDDDDEDHHHDANVFMSVCGGPIFVPI